MGKEAVARTTKLHEVVSMNCEIPANRKRTFFPAQISDLSCKCVNCCLQQDSHGDLPDLCRYNWDCQTMFVNITIDRNGNIKNDNIDDANKKNLVNNLYISTGRRHKEQILWFRYHQMQIAHDSWPISKKICT